MNKFEWKVDQYMRIRKLQLIRKNGVSYAVSAAGKATTNIVLVR